MMSVKPSESRRAGVLARLDTIRRDVSGNLGLLTAILAVPLLIAAGSVVDIGVAYDERERLQGVADGAALAGAAVFNGANKTEATAVVEDFVKAHLGAKGSKLVVDFERGEVNVVLTKSVPTAFMAIVGQPDVAVGVTASALAKRTISAMTITPVNASGWWYKLVRVLVVRENSTVEEEVGRAVYRPDKWDGSNRSGTMVVSPTTVFSLGKYQKLILEMSVKEDGCPIGTKINQPKGAGTIKCDPSKAAYDNKYNRIMRTDDPATMTNFFIDKVRWSTAKKLPIEEYLSCTAKQEHAWEDGGTNPPVYGQHDFTYYVESACETRSGARLTR